MRILMLKQCRFIPPEDRRLGLKYLPGVEYTVKRTWGAAMVKSGHAQEIDAPPRHRKDKSQ